MSLISYSNIFKVFYKVKSKHTCFVWTFIVNCHLEIWLLSTFFLKYDFKNINTLLYRYVYDQQDLLLFYNIGILLMHLIAFLNYLLHHENVAKFMVIELMCNVSLVLLTAISQLRGIFYELGYSNHSCDVA